MSAPFIQDFFLTSNENKDHVIDGRGIDRVDLYQRPALCGHQWTGKIQQIKGELLCDRFICKQCYKAYRQIVVKDVEEVKP